MEYFCAKLISNANLKPAAVKIHQLGWGGWIVGFLINSNLHPICDQEVGLRPGLNAALLSGAMVICLFSLLGKSYISVGVCLTYSKMCFHVG